MSISSFYQPRWNPPVRKKPVVHMHRGIEITRKNGGIGMYVATVAGQAYSNTRLGDLKRQIGDVLDAAHDRAEYERDKQS
jgi:hypothetical protein